MDNFTILITQYSVAEIAILIILLGTSVKFIIELGQWFYKTFQAYFGKQQQEKIDQDGLIEKLDSLGLKIDSLGEKISTLEKRVSTAEGSVKSLKNKVHDMNDAIVSLEEQSQRSEESLDLIQERLQNQARDRLIELHHKYMYEYGMIDDIGLQSMERTYLYYKAAGGNTFIDTLMDEVRALPRPALENKNILEAIQ